MTRPLLAAVLDGRVVVLDAQHARVILLDPRTEQIWRACTGLMGEEIAANVREASSEVRHTLRELAEAGLVSSEQDRWRQARVTWI